MIKEKLQSQNYASLILMSGRCKVYQVSIYIVQEINNAMYYSYF